MGSKAKGHALAKGEKIVAENGDLAVTSDGRKVRLADGKVIERLVGPPYGWESDEAGDDEGEGE